MAMAGGAAVAFSKVESHFTTTVVLNRFIHDILIFKSFFANLSHCSTYEGFDMLVS